MRITPAPDPPRSRRGMASCKIRATRVRERMTARNLKLKVAQAREVAMTTIRKPISSGSLMGVRKRTMESAPRRPSDRGSENWMQTKMDVIARLRSGKARWI